LLATPGDYCVALAAAGFEILAERDRGSFDEAYWPGGRLSAQLPLADAAAPRCFRSLGQLIRRIGHLRRTPAPYLTNTAKYWVCDGAVVIGDQRTTVNLGPTARLQFELLTQRMQSDGD